jgi:hypothetical protein
MECPKCGAEIEKSAMVCPNCKKVLKIVCPVCRTVNEKNICRKCGEILVTKCVKCGKINLLKNKNCVKCGFSNEISAVLNESNSETFALLRIDFPNLDVVKANLGSNQLYQKFRANFDGMINSYVKTLNLRRQIVKNNIYIIRFCKDYTMTASANSAIQATIELANLITKLNVKLLKKKNIAVKCNFTIMQKDANNDPYDIKLNFNANMLYQSSEKDTKALDFVQVITDENFYDLYNEQYKLESLDASLVEGEMKRIYEINIKEFININEFIKEEKQKEKDSQDTEIPNFVQTALIDQDKITQEALVEENNLQDEDSYDLSSINFEEINCAFFKTESINILDCVTKTLQEVPKGIFAIRANQMYQPYTLKLLSTVDELGIYDNIVPITCSDEMEYMPFSFFRELISSIFDYTASQKLFKTNDFSMFSQIDKEGLLKDLITLTKRPMTDILQVRENYCNLFASLLQAIPNTIIYIENYDKIDESSMFVLEKLFDHFDEFNISYLISYNKDFALHHKCHFLLSRPYYTEVVLIPTPTKSIIELDFEFYKNILTDFYFQRIAKYACGSTLFLDFAIQYLIESGVYEYSENSIEMINPKTIIIPSNLEKLIKRRLNILKDDDAAIRFLTMTILLGTRIDEKTLEDINFPNWRDIIDNLSSTGYMYIYNNCIYFPNYNLLKKCLVEILKPEILTEIIQALFDKAYIESMPAPIKGEYYDITKDNQNAISEWEKLANINLSMGDFPSYLNCSIKILEILDKYANEWSKEDFNKYKSELYENVSNNLLDYNPEEFENLAKETLISLHKNNNKKKYILFCTKIIQGSILHGQYLDALKLTHEVLSLFEEYSIAPEAPNFDLNLLIMSIIYVKILFNIGAYSDCLDIGYNVLNVLDDQKINHITFDIISKEEFKYLVIECIGYIALVDIITMKEDIIEFFNISKKLLTFIPNSYSIFEQLQNLIKGEKVTLTPKMDGDDSITAILYQIIGAFVNHKDNPEKFAQQIYKAKLISKETNLHIFEIFVDLMIGYSYINLGNFKKASSMIYEIIKTSKEKGLNSISHIGWYILSILHIKEGKFDMAYEVLNNSEISMEKAGIASDYLTLLNKINLYKVLMCTNHNEQAQICMTQASQIVQNHHLNFNLNIDIKKIMLENSNRERENKQLNTTKSQKAQTNTNQGLNSSELDGEVINPSEFYNE